MAGGRGDGGVRLRHHGQVHYDGFGGIWAHLNTSSFTKGADKGCRTMYLVAHITRLAGLRGGGTQVHRARQALMGMSLACVLIAGVSACGSSSTSSKSGGTVTILMGTAPDSLDPGLGATTQSYEATWIAYTGLVTYAHASGEAGAKLIPGLAESLPTVSSDGKTYTFTLRKGL